MERRDVGQEGENRIAQFLGAPPKVQAAFMAQLRGATEAQHDFDRWLSEAEDDDPVPPEQPDSRLHPLPKWTRSWAKRGIGARAAAEADGRDFETERTRLLEIPPSEYVHVLTGEETRGRPIICPLPDHDERTPSFHAHRERWRCYGCGRSGRIYDLAGALWDLEPEGPSFKQIHEELLRLFP